MALQVGLQTIAILILPNISQSKGNQTMKFGHKTLTIDPVMCSILIFQKRDWD